jgi:hypothetical protein
VSESLEPFNNRIQHVQNKKFQKSFDLVTWKHIYFCRAVESKATDKADASCEPHAEASAAQDDGEVNMSPSDVYIPGVNRKKM